MAVNASPLRARLLGTLNTDSTITGVTTGTSQGIPVAPYENFTVYVFASDALSAGVLLVEEADYDQQQTTPYSGTWSQVSSTTLSSTFAAAGGQVGIHLPAGAYGYLRVRIGTTVVGGTITAVLRAN